jgi:nucleotide-binding universal stress UspA family protein
MRTCRRQSCEALSQMPNRGAFRHRPPVIVQMARKDNDDVIVMSMHGTSAVHDLLIGNVVERVVRSATCPVVLIPPPKRMKRKD